MGTEGVNDAALPRILVHSVFADDRIIPRFHLDGILVSELVSVFKIDSPTSERLGLLRTAIFGESGWLDLIEPIIVRAGEAFLAVPEKEDSRS